MKIIKIKMRNAEYPNLQLAITVYALSQYFKNVISLLTHSMSTFTCVVNQWTHTANEYSWRTLLATTCQVPIKI